MIRITQNLTRRRMTLEEFLRMPIIVPEEVEVPAKLRPIADEVCDRHNVMPRHIFGNGRDKQCVEARADFVRTLHFKHRHTAQDIAHIMKMDPTSVKHYLGLRSKSKVKYDDLRLIYG